MLKFLIFFKHVQTNMPLLQEIKQVSTSAKFLMNICIVKRCHRVQKKAFLTEKVSMLFQTAMPLNDSGWPTILCMIGQYNIYKALLDLGGNVISYHILFQNSWA